MSRQIDFSAALLDSARAVPDGLVDPLGRPAHKRFDVYRNNVVVSLIDAMKEGFPVIHKLIGAENFTNICGLFVRKHPPRSPVLMFYGTEFPNFLEAFPPLAHLPYLGDVARLELALRDSYHAADAQSMGPEVFEGLGEDVLVSARIDLLPATRILCSPYPIVGIWHFNMREDAAKPSPQAECALISRPAFDPDIEIIDGGTAAVLRALQQGQTLGDAIAASQEIAPDYDPSVAIGTLLRAGLIAALKTH